MKTLLLILLSFAFSCSTPSKKSYTKNTRNPSHDFYDGRVNELLDLFGVKLSSNDRTLVQASEQLLTGAVSGFFALLVLKPDRKVVSVHFTVVNNLDASGKPSPAFLENLEKTLRSIKAQNPGSRLEHAFPSASVHRQLGWDDSILKVFKKVYPRHKSLLTGRDARRYAELREAGKIDDAHALHDKIRKEKLAESLARKNSVSYTIGDISGKMADELDYFKNAGVSVTPIKNFGDVIEPTQGALDRRKALRKKEFRRRSGRLLTAGIAIVKGLQGICTYIDNDVKVGAITVFSPNTFAVIDPETEEIDEELFEEVELGTEDADLPPEWDNI